MTYRFVAGSLHNDGSEWATPGNQLNGFATVKSRTRIGPMMKAGSESVANVSAVETFTPTVEIDRPGRRRKGIRVLEADMLPGFLGEHPRVLEDEQVARLRERLQEPETLLAETRNYWAEWVIRLRGSRLAICASVVTPSYRRCERGCKISHRSIS